MARTIHTVKRAAYQLEAMTWLNGMVDNQQTKIHLKNLPLLMTAIIQYCHYVSSFQGSPLEFIRTIKQSVVSMNKNQDIDQNLQYAMQEVPNWFCLNNGQSGLMYDHLNGQQCVIEDQTEFNEAVEFCKHNKTPRLLKCTEIPMTSNFQNINLAIILVVLVPFISRLVGNFHQEKKLLIKLMASLHTPVMTDSQQCNIEIYNEFLYLIENSFKCI